jgi:hypothetical protein
VVGTSSYENMVGVIWYDPSAMDGIGRSVPSRSRLKVVVLSSFPLTLHERGVRVLMVIILANLLCSFVGLGMVVGAWM